METTDAISEVPKPGTHGGCPLASVGVSGVMGGHPPRVGLRGTQRAAPFSSRRIQASLDRRGAVPERAVGGKGFPRILGEAETGGGGHLRTLAAKAIGPTTTTQQQRTNPPSPYPSPTSWARGVRQILRTRTSLKPS